MEIKIGKIQGNVIRELIEKRNYYTERKDKLFRLFRRDLITRHEYEREYQKACFEEAEILNTIVSLVEYNL